MEDIETVTFAAARRSDPHPARGRVLTYLESAATLTDSGAFTEDLLDVDSPRTVPVGFATDGTLVWDLSLLHYLRRYETLVIPQPLIDAAERTPRCVPVADSRLRSIREHVFGQGDSGGG